MAEHVLQNDSSLHLSSSALQGSFNSVPHLAENTFYQQHIVKAEDYDSYSVPQWIGYQQMSPYYVEYLLGNGISNMQREVPHDNNNNSNGIGCSFTSEESFHSTHVSQKQGADEGLNNAAQYQSNRSTSTSGILPKSRKTYLRQKATATDRRRRTRIAAALDALEDLLPQSKEGNKANIIDDCIDYIKYLQLQMKELSQHRLGGEPTCNHLTYLEGYGYYVIHGNTASGPLQDMVGKLLEVNPSAAAELLESQRLFMTPIAPN